MTELKIDPVPKPRMTGSDRWKHRPVVDRYFAFKDRLVLLCKRQKFVLSDNYKVEFLIAMPKYWSARKRNTTHGMPHRSKPDLDNLVKALNDCLMSNDASIWHIEATKCWWDEGKILIHNRK